MTLGVKRQCYSQGLRRLRDKIVIACRAGKQECSHQALCFGEFSGIIARDLGLLANFAELTVERENMSEQIGRVAFIGPGVMGYPMAGHLAKHASSAVVFNRNTARATQWLNSTRAAQGNAHCTTPKGAAAQADVVFVCVGNDDDVAQVVLDDEGALAAWPQAPCSLTTRQRRRVG